MEQKSDTKKENGLQYAIRVLRRINLNRVTGCIKKCRDKSGKSGVRIFFDMLGCIIKYGAGFHDYMLFEFYNLNADQRSSYMTRLKNRRMIEDLNSTPSVSIIESKVRFNEDYARFLGRRWINIQRSSDEELTAFIETVPTFFAKPDDSESGKGIALLAKEDFDNPQALISFLRDPANNFALAEEPLRQHEALAKLYPCSVNCLRMVTIINNDQPHVIYAVLKTGNHGKFVDNLENGGYSCHVDLSTGKVIGPGHTSNMEISETHSYTGIRFVGFEIPYFKEACRFAEEVAMVHPDVRYIGWDVCITPTGPAIIEGNPYSGYDFPQLPDYSQPKCGYIKKIYDRCGYVVPR